MRSYLIESRIYLERSWFLELEEKDKACLPDFLIKAAQKAAEEKGVSKPIINLSRSLIIPFLQFSPNRELRKKAQEAWASRGEHGEETDNRPIARETLALRRQMANLLGYTNFAEFKLETEMAKKPENVEGLLLQVWKYAKERAQKDQNILAEYMTNDGISDDFYPWDWLLSYLVFHFSP